MGFDSDLLPTREALATIASAVEAERHCCRFFRFGITVEADGGRFWLGVRRFAPRVAQDSHNLSAFHRWLYLVDLRLNQRIRSDRSRVCRPMT